MSAPRTLLRWLVLATVSWVPQAASAAASGFLALHPGASIWGEIVIEDRAIGFKIEGAADPFQTCLALPHLPIGPLEDDQVAANRAAILKFIGDELVFRIDGVEVEPVLEQIHVQDGKPEDMSWRSTWIRLTYSCEKAPQRVSVLWPRFEGEGVTYVPIVIRRGAKGSPRQFSLYEDEPEYTWHADSVRPRLGQAIKRQKGPTRTKDIPVPSLLAIAVAAASLLFAAKLPRTLWISGLAAGIVAAVMLKPVGVASVPWPFAGAAPLPAAAQAKELFAALNANVYRAFDAETESAIYDLLADSVDASLLDDLYGQVYESLILREQNGAICSVDDLEVVDGSVDLDAFPDADPPQFKVDWHWRVMGAVSHWGHVHRRMNEYRADFIVRNDGETWKIAAVTVKDQQRVDEFE